MNNKKVIKEIVTNLSFVLQIPVPKIYFSNNSILGNKIACLSMPEKVLYICPELPISETILAISHEMRHLWQLEHGLFQDEIGSSETYIDSQIDFEKYLMQKSEIDANAFAQIMCIKLLGIKPLWQNYPKNVRDSIQKRISEIIDIIN